MNPVLELPLPFVGTDMDKKNTEWVEPEIKNLGEAKDLIKGLNPVFDSKNSLVPSDELKFLSG